MRAMARMLIVDWAMKQAMRLAKYIALVAVIIATAAIVRQYPSIEELRVQQASSGVGTVKEWKR
jgi:hypothetical protein